MPLAQVDSWEPYAGLLVGMLCVLLGVIFRAGAYRSAARWYFDDRSPWYIRHLPFGLIPFGLMMVLWVGAALSVGRMPDALMWAVWALGGLCFLTAIMVMYRPPATLKPAWLREEETDRAPVRGHEVGGGPWRFVDRLAFWFMAALAAGGMGIFLIMVFVALARS